MADSENIIQALTQVLDEGKLRTDADSLESHGKDWTKMYEAKPLAIAFPRSTEQVQAIVKLANELEFAIVPSGGRTGLSGGAVATNGEVVVSFDYMNNIVDFSASDRSVKVQAGVVTQQLQAFAEENGLYYPVDFASAGSSQIGGNLSTNAGGIKVIKYGMSRDWVLGLAVVTGAGEILNLTLPSLDFGFVLQIRGFKKVKLDESPLREVYGWAAFGEIEFHNVGIEMITSIKLKNVLTEEINKGDDVDDWSNFNVSTNRILKDYVDNSSKLDKKWLSKATKMKKKDFNKHIKIIKKSIGLRDD